MAIPDPKGISFINDFFKKDFGEYNISMLDRFRLLRDCSVYRALPISAADANDCLKFSKGFVKIAKKLNIWLD